MSIPYKGRAPDSDFSVVTRQYVDDRYAAIKVDDDYVDAAVTTKGLSLVTPTYVDQQDAALAKKTAVDAADALYVPNSSKGQASGVPSLDGSTYIPSSQLGTVQQGRRPTAGVVTNIYLSGERELLVVNPKEYRIASLTIADPGFPYIPLVFAIVRGGATNGVQNNVDKGTGNYAQLSILRAGDDVRYGWMVTTGQKALDFHSVVPYAALSATPTSVPPCTGSTVLELWAGLYGGSTYLINDTGLMFCATAMPAL